MITYSLENEANVTVSILKGNTTVRALFSDRTLPGSYAVQWDGKDASGSTVGDAQYTYQIIATSPTVSSFVTTYSDHITVEANEPLVTGPVVSPVILKIGSTATIRYSISEAATVYFQTYDSDGNLIWDASPIVKTAAGSYTLSWDGKDSSGTLITSGSYTAKMLVVDTLAIKRVEK